MSLTREQPGGARDSVELCDAPIILGRTRARPGRRAYTSCSLRRSYKMRRRILPPHPLSHRGISCRVSRTSYLSLSSPISLIFKNRGKQRRRGWAGNNPLYECLIRTARTVIPRRNLGFVSVLVIFCRSYMTRVYFYKKLITGSFPPFLFDTATLVTREKHPCSEFIAALV